MQYKATYKTPQGFSDMMMMSDGEVLTGLHFIDSRKATRNCRDCTARDLPVFRETCRWLDEYFGGVVCGSNRTGFGAVSVATGTGDCRDIGRSRRYLPSHTSHGK